MKNRLTIGLIFLAMVLSSCCDYEADERVAREITPVPLELSLAVNPLAAGGRTRMADEVVQTDETQARGIDALATCFIPFVIKTTATAVRIGDVVKRNIVQNSQTDETLTRKPYYFWSGTDCQFMQGVNAFLVYTRATRGTGGDRENGALTFGHDGTYDPGKISFSLKQMVPTLEVTADAQRVADYLTGIANSTANGVSWRNINYAVLDTLYNYFINQNRSLDPQPMGGSASNAVAHVMVLRKALQDADFSKSSGAEAIKNAILGNITAGLTEGEDGSLKLNATDYPASTGLPDGAAVVRWNSATMAFEPLIQTTATANINSITRYVYPAELWYRANSRIRTRSEEIEAAYEPTTYSWQQVLDIFYGSMDGEVTHSVKSVAIKDQLQYAVARMNLKLSDTKSTLLDADGEEIPVGDGSSFPLTGVVIGGQRPVDFEFKTIVPDDLDAYVRFIYDGQVNKDDGSPRLAMTAGSSVSADSVSTLVLQSLDGEDIPLLLEFQNKSDMAFKGVNGVIRPGTKFYLAGEIKLSEATGSTDADVKSRVFTQDYTTTVTVGVASLAKAYNILPDLLSARLEVGVQLVTEWDESSPSYVPLR